MALNLGEQERRQCFFEVGGRVLEVADAISDMTKVQWETMKQKLNTTLVDRAQSLHEQEKMNPVEAIIQAARECREQQLMDLAAMNAQPFGEQL